ncbi:hypothetical protein DMB42_29100 [Nonomuraea sp. WAC 01424]|uniref:MAB_1171c family putative transporter n=1 Tax=Nonomuraea sp. WAC 01424 TaxID=2203200 RepID=UPI000F7B0988|nr:MAB_1171c family putative transporter [Nonomuraea sp. WAC 01424]RSN04856.1 hypothetical protein DMB42_29100 [Nonomuraea sp. WAC 01424]
MGEWLRLNGPAVLACALTAYRLAAVRSWARDPAGRAVFVILAAIAASTTVNTPWAYDAVWRLTGVPNLARLVSHAFMLAVAWSVGTFVRQVGQPPEGPRRRTWGEAAWPALVLLGMCLTFALARTPVNSPRFAVRYGDTPGVLEYWLVFLCYLVPVLCHATWFALREARQTENRAVGAGLRLIAVGASLTVLYHLHKAAYFACRRVGADYPDLLRAPLDMLLVPLGVLAVLLGLALPSWWPARLRWFRDFRLHLRLRPLWRALYRASPDIALLAPAPFLTELVTFRDLDLRLYRRFVEIRDGRIALEPYLDARVTDAARREGARSGLRGQRLEAFAEAAAVDAAIRARARGLPPDGGAGTAAVPGGVDLSSDAAFLGLVSRAYRRLGAR